MDTLENLQIYRRDSASLLPRKSSAVCCESIPVIPERSGPGAQTESPASSRSGGRTRLIAGRPYGMSVTLRLRSVSDFAAAQRTKRLEIKRKLDHIGTTESHLAIDRLMRVGAFRAPLFFIGDFAQSHGDRMRFDLTEPTLHQVETGLAKPAIARDRRDRWPIGDVGFSFGARCKHHAGKTACTLADHGRATRTRAFTIVNCETLSKRSSRRCSIVEDPIDREPITWRSPPPASTGRWCGAVDFAAHGSGTRRKDGASAVHAERAQALQAAS